MWMEGKARFWRDKDRGEEIFVNCVERCFEKVVLRLESAAHIHLRQDSGLFSSVH